MYLKRIIAIIVCIVFVMAGAFTAFAENDEDYCYDEDAFTYMSIEEVNDKMLELGVGLNKLEGRAGYIVDRIIEVLPDRANSRIQVFYTTSASMVANEIGVKNLRFYRSDSSGDTLLKRDARLYTGFSKYYSGGYYYNSPTSGKTYYAVGTNYAIFTTTEVNLYTPSNTMVY